MTATKSSRAAYDAALRARFLAEGAFPFFHVNHPLRPQRPPGIPMAGDDNAAFRLWERACDLCRYSDDRYGCTSSGVVEYTSGRKYGFARVRGGCTRWWLRGIGA